MGTTPPSGGITATALTTPFVSSPAGSDLTLQAGGGATTLEGPQKFYNAAAPANAKSTSIVASTWNFGIYFNSDDGTVSNAAISINRSGTTATDTTLYGNFWLYGYITGYSGLTINGHFYQQRGVDPIIWTSDPDTGYPSIFMNCIWADAAGGNGRFAINVTNAVSFTLYDQNQNAADFMTVYRNGNQATGIWFYTTINVPLLSTSSVVCTGAVTAGGPINSNTDIGAAGTVFAAGLGITGAVNIGGNVNINGYIAAPAALFGEVSGNGWEGWDNTITRTTIGINQTTSEPWIRLFNRNAFWTQTAFAISLDGTGAVHFRSGNDTNAYPYDWFYMTRQSTGEPLQVVFGCGISVGGDLYVTGAKNFRIDHPLDPTKSLVHSAIEGPESAVFYRGEAETINGKATVTLPEYFEALTFEEDRTVQLTSLIEDEDDEFDRLAATRVKDGKFVVKSLKPSQKFYWEVKAVRKDIPKLVVVRDKQAARVDEMQRAARESVTSAVAPDKPPMPTPQIITPPKKPGTVQARRFAYETSRK